MKRGPYQTMKGARTLARLTVAAREIASRWGIAAVTFASVGKRAGVSAGAVQWHFQKLVLLQLAVLSCWHRTIRLHIVEPARSLRGLPRVWSIAKAWLVRASHLELPLEVYAGRLADASDLHGSVRTSISRILEYLREDLRAAFEDARHDGALREPASPEGLADSALASLLGIFWAQRLRSEQEGLQSATRAIWTQLKSCAVVPDAIPPFAQCWDAVREQLTEEQVLCETQLEPALLEENVHWLDYDGVTPFRFDEELPF